MRPRFGRVLLGVAGTAAVLTAAPPAGAAVVANGSPGALAGAMADGGKTGGLVLTGASFAMLPPSGAPVGYGDAALSGFPTSGGTFAVMSTGDVTKAPSTMQGGNTSSSNGGPGRGGSDRDTVVLKVDFTIPSGANCVSFDFRFFSEEYPEYVGRSYNDAFIAELDKTTWTTAGSAITAPDNIAFDPAGNVISINATGPTSVSAENAVGTTYDAGTVLLHASSTVTPGAHSLYFSLFDQGDASLDSTVFIDNLVARTASAGGCTAGATTAPPTVAPVGAASTPPAFGKNGVVSMPSTKKCTSRRLFKIRLRRKKGVVYDWASVYVNGKRVRVYVRYKKKWRRTARPRGSMV
ncbi:choice-of-anchor L domain-containing protein, partial [Paraconexibacter sp.]|uniref:choice-of-anchor L domain-containing protein n=1 Tax=Paraconexibacter sp. TaxID=2949640 RepID=UPI003565F856